MVSGVDSEESVVIGCAADTRYALPLAVMLRSVAANLAPERRLFAFVVADGLAPDDRRRVRDSLPEQAALEWLEPRRSGFPKLPLWGRMPITTYDKLTIADLLPPDVRRVIWLDCDLLVRDDLARLWDLDLDHHHALAAQDALVPRVSSRFGVAGYAELGLPPDAKYFNAGVMVIDPGRWRRDRIGERALEYLERFRESVFFWDQEALNVVLAGRWGELDPRWNWNVSLGPPPPAMGAPHVLHFTGYLKPWEYPNRSAAHELYLSYLDQTAWAHWRPPRNWRTVLLGRYGDSRPRKLLRPLEQWWIRLVRATTRRYGR